MAEITQETYPLNPTLRLVNAEGRATSEFFRVLKAIGKVLEAVNIVDGEITTDMLADLAVSAEKLGDAAVVVGKLAAGSIYVDTLFVNNVVKTGAVASNAISEITAILQVGSAGPDGDTILSGSVPVTTTGNTGLLLTFTGFMDRPVLDASNFGYWKMHLQRNGVTIDSTPDLFYDDNFSYQPVASFIDTAPGTNPTYSVITSLTSGLGDFTVTGSVLNVGLLKR